MTVLDTSAVVDLVLGDGVAEQVEELVRSPLGVAAPDVVVFETLAALRRAVLRRWLSPARAERAIGYFLQLPLETFPGIGLVRGAWGLRHNVATADAMFVVLAEHLDEPLATKDRGLAAAARALGVETIEL